MATSEVSILEETGQSPWAGSRMESGFGQHYTPLPEKSEDGVITSHAVQTILADSSQLYNLWKEVSLIPRWQEQVISVTALDNNVSHWVMGDPEGKDGARIEFDSKIIEDVPGYKLGWRSITPDVAQSGAVTFKPSPEGRGTLVTLIQTAKAPAAGIASTLAGIAKRSPKQMVVENLRHFKQLAESGEIPSVKGQPHGPRGISGGFKEWLYGENNPTPPGTSDRQ